MDLQKPGVKFFIDKPVELEEFLPVFHRWIREGTLEGLWFDVADYRHLPDGPAVALVGHDGDYFVDLSEGPLGLLFIRKTPLDGSGPERILSTARSALFACSMLEKEFKGRLKFRGGRMLFLINDRLTAPNNEQTFAACQSDLRAAAEKLFPNAELKRDAADPRNRFAVWINSPDTADVSGLLARLR